MGEIKKNKSGNKIGHCSVEGCDKYGPLTRTWCTRHYARVLRKGSLGSVGLMRAPNNATPEELIKYHGYLKVGTCWEARGNRNEDGYVIWRTKWSSVGAHRASYGFYKGVIPEGFEVMHACDNRACINPEHLSVGTHTDNMRDCAVKGRAPGSKLTADQVRSIRNRYESGEHKNDLASEFGVSPSNILLIVKRVNWAWLD